MKFLLLDIGNTSIAYSTTFNDKVQEIKRVKNIENPDNFIDSLNFSDINKVVICSVVPSISDSIINILKLKNIEFFEVNYTNCGIKLLVNNPSDVGADRICNVVGANKINKSTIIIDFGTATTYDVTNEYGDFIGGSIGPGIDISADYLIEKAALLKDTIYTFPDKIIGQSTESNIQSGVMYGGLFSVIGMINAIKLEMKNPDMQTIITGGFGKLISDNLSIEHIYSKSLTMDGMIQIYSNNFLNQTGK
tara:strand:+ start:930 stop:1676 length:747 start_codon:yes stop_codon:yes gene_type:complete